MLFGAFHELFLSQNLAVPKFMTTGRLRRADPEVKGLRQPHDVGSV
jgi:hypothetical protein